MGHGTKCQFYHQVHACGDVDLIFLDTGPTPSAITTQPASFAYTTLSHCQPLTTHFPHHSLPFKVFQNFKF